MSAETDAQPTLLDGETVPAADLRRELLGGVYPNAGIVQGLNAAATATPSMAVTLPAGFCLVDDGAGGFVPVVLAADATLDIAASDPSLPRIDSVIAEIVDTGDGDTLIHRFRVITGTAASSPTEPALPPSDQSTALTLRLANVAVRANAETSGNVRPQDVSVKAVAATLLPRPVQTLQASPLDNPSGTGWTDFTTGQWPRITFTAPASGMVFVTIGAEVDNENTSTATCRVGFRMSGGFTFAADFGHEMGGHIFTTASRRYLVSGMTPGVSVTITPVYRLSTIGDTRLIHNGNMILELVP